MRQGGSKGKELFVFDYVRHELHECGSQAEFNAITQEIRERNDPNSTASKERIKQLMRDAGKPKLQKV